MPIGEDANSITGASVVNVRGSDPHVGVTGVAVGVRGSDLHVGVTGVVVGV